MASIYVAIPSPARLEENTDRFLAAMNSGTREPQNVLFTDIAFDFVDTMLEGLFHGPTRQIELTGFRRKLVDSLGGLIEKTTHGLIRSVVAKLSNEELRRLQGFVEERRLVIDGKPYVSFPLPPHFTTRYQAMHESTMSGSPVSGEARADVMNEFTDIALDYMLKRPVDLLKLGFISRKAADLGYSSMRSLAHSTVRKLSADVSLEENQRLSTYFYQLMREGPDYRGS
ncbi:MAG: hypothetical protein ACOY33_04490 [Pseudomonadota bacterium]